MHPSDRPLCLPVGALALSYPHYRVRVLYRSLLLIRCIPSPPTPPYIHPCSAGLFCVLCDTRPFCVYRHTIQPQASLLSAASSSILSMAINPYLYRRHLHLSIVTVFGRWSKESLWCHFGHREGADVDLTADEDGVGIVVVWRVMLRLYDRNLRWCHARSYMLRTSEVSQLRECCRTNDLSCPFRFRIYSSMLGTHTLDPGV
ncbi:hypothetical protein BDN70DRAFT_887274 [Pholiota conissans]|uniref:Uncharacterized protein n=1 Tax=Pholiota conissans TaxID=109636 RepID=A0A9P6CU29_9AGAR|nr:hypothetical protein BDN70DRAFT_887274 [Pholiota conissans]